LRDKGHIATQIARLADRQHIPVAAAVLACGPAVLSHVSAAAGRGPNRDSHHSFESDRDRDTAAAAAAAEHGYLTIRITTTRLAHHEAPRLHRSLQGGRGRRDHAA
jgi:hypothetical protein